MWQISSGGFIRFTKTTKFIVRPNEEQIGTLNNFFITNFSINLDEIKVIRVVDNYLFHDLEIITKSNTIINKRYKENDLPVELEFYKYKFNINEDNVSEDNITCKILYGCSY